VLFLCLFFQKEKGKAFRLFPFSFGYQFLFGDTFAKKYPVLELK